MGAFGALDPSSNLGRATYFYTVFKMGVTKFSNGVTKINKSLSFMVIFSFVIGIILMAVSGGVGGIN